MLPFLHLPDALQLEQIRGHPLELVRVQIDPGEGVEALDGLPRDFVDLVL